MAWDRDCRSSSNSQDKLTKAAFSRFFLFLHEIRQNPTEKDGTAGECEDCYSISYKEERSDGT